jgi:hypothetical protein
MKCQEKHPETGERCEWQVSHGTHIHFDFEAKCYREWRNEEAPSLVPRALPSRAENNAKSEAEDRRAYEWAHPSGNDGRFWWIR